VGVWRAVDARDRRDDTAVTAATCLVGTREWAAKQDHPAHIPPL